MYSNVHYVDSSLALHPGNWVRPEHWGTRIQYQDTYLYSGVNVVMDTVCTGHAHHTNTWFKVWFLLWSTGHSVNGHLMRTWMNERPWGEGVGDSLSLGVPLSVVLYSFKHHLKLVLLGNRSMSNIKRITQCSESVIYYLHIKIRA